MKLKIAAALLLAAGLGLAQLPKPGGSSSGSASSSSGTATVVSPAVVCDGATDNSAVLQAALNSLPSGGTVMLPAGVCVVNTLPLTITTSGVNLQGQGARTTWLQSTDTTHDFLQMTGGSSDCGANALFKNWVRDLALKRSTPATAGNGVTVDKGCEVELSHVFIRDSFHGAVIQGLSPRIVLNDVEIYFSSHSDSPRYGVYPYQGYSIYLDQVTVSSTDTSTRANIEGVHMNGGTVTDVFIDKLETAFTDYGVRTINRMQDVHLTNSILDSCGVACVYVESSCAEAQPGVVIDGGWANGGGTNARGVDIRHSCAVTLTNMSINAQASGGKAIHSDGTGHKISSNIIKSSPTGIELDCNGCSVTDNFFYSDSGNAFGTALSMIAVDASGTGNYVAGNSIDGYFTTFISLASATTNNVVYPNYCDLAHGTTCISNAGTGNDLGKQNGVPSVDAASCTGATLGTGSTNLAGTITGLPGSACSVVLTFGNDTATTGWACTVNDQTTAALFRQSAGTQTTATFAGTSVASDVLRYACNPY